MKIAFYVAHFTLRGTEIATYDYARYAEDLLGHEVVIIAQDGHPDSDPRVQAKFATRFPIIFTPDFSEVDQAVAKSGAGLFYIIKYGKNDGRVVTSAPNAVHAVFKNSVKDVHGERYAFVSEWLSRYCTKGAVPFVPHIVNPPPPSRNIRPDLGIPSDATVFGSYGGRESFDVGAARRAVAKVAVARRDAWFVFMNIAPFVQHERVLFLPGTSDPQEKSNFIAACDAMLHARRRGETFGLSCAEFSAFNRPVITFGGSRERSHIELLGHKAILYRTGWGLARILKGFDRRDAASKEWDCYSKRFSPEAVMPVFQRVFVGPEWAAHSLPKSGFGQ